jgi:alkanesulfonate monooxygenase SsuD/methylene tetrahydromethanopterin reductase-like flavin-dependent oxidoreductase (luciferase family)
MKFGVLQFLQLATAACAIADCLQVGSAAHRHHGYNRLRCRVAGQAPLCEYNICPSVHLMGIHMAGQTQHLRIGTGISLAAFYHPLRLAEEVALLDVFSGGRVHHTKAMHASGRLSRSC